MQIPFVGFQLVRTSEHMASAGVFVLLQAVLVLKYVQNYMSKAEFKYFFLMAGSIAAGLVFLTVVALTWAAGGTGFVVILLLKNVPSEIPPKWQKVRPTLWQKKVLVKTLGNLAVTFGDYTILYSLQSDLNI